MHVLAAAKPVVPSPLDCSALHAWNSSQCTNLHQKPVLPHLCPFTAAIECDLLSTSWQQQSKAKASIISIVYIVSDPIPSHLVSRASAVILAPVPWWPHKF